MTCKLVDEAHAKIGSVESAIVFGCFGMCDGACSKVGGVVPAIGLTLFKVLQHAVSTGKF